MKTFAFAVMALFCAGAQAQQPAAGETLYSKWQYRGEKDEMGSTSKSAVLMSETELDFGFPYKGRQWMKLTLRTHSQHGKNVLLTITRGQFVCGVSNCNILVRFDEGKPQTFSAAPAADHDSTVLFITNYDRFLAQIAKSKHVVIAPTFYREGSPNIVFQSAGFDPKRFAAGK